MSDKNHYLASKWYQPNKLIKKNESSKNLLSRFYKTLNMLIKLSNLHGWTQRMTTNITNKEARYTTAIWRLLHKTASKMRTVLLLSSAVPMLSVSLVSLLIHSHVEPK